MQSLVALSAASTDRLRWMSGRKDSAFTLIELLVVVAIITLLTSILLPSLQNARERAKAVKCQANLRQNGNSLQLYIAENNNIVPSSITLAATSANAYKGSITDSNMFCPSTLGNTRYFQTSSNGKTYATSYVSARGLNVFTSAAVAKYSDYQLPASTYFAADAAQKQTYNSFLTSASTLSLPSLVYLGSYTPTFDGRHAGYGNVLWFDGHVSPEWSKTFSPDPTTAKLMDIYHLGILAPIKQGTSWQEFGQLNNRMKDYYFLAIRD